MRVLHVITDLGLGGAEAVLYRLIVATKHNTQHCVVSLHSDGVYGEKLREIGVNVHVLNMPRSKLRFSSLLQLRRIILDFAPNVVQTRMYHADLLGGVAAFYSGKLPVVWAVHATELGVLSGTWKTRIVRRICSILSSRLPFAIVTDAKKSAEMHVALGYPASKTIVIPNGIDLSQFHQDKAQRDMVRQKLSIEAESTVIGCVARWDPLKDHANLLQALEILLAKNIKTFCLLVGSGMQRDNVALMKLISDYGLESCVILMGPRSDISAIMNAIDLHVLPSCSESLPLAVMEAMSCGTPCVVTNVGDAAEIVGDTGWVVAPRSPASLATAIEDALQTIGMNNGPKLGQICRDRILQYFSQERMADEYVKVWEEAIHAN